MGKFRNFFRKPAAQPQVQGTPDKSKVETAVVLCLQENGGQTIGYVNVSGIEMQRPATIKDMYRMVCDVKAHLEAAQAAEQMMGNFRRAQPGNLPPAMQSHPEIKEEVKEIKGNKEGYSGDQGASGNKLEDKK